MPVPTTQMSGQHGSAAGDQHKLSSDRGVGKHDAVSAEQPRAGQGLPSAPKPSEPSSPRGRISQGVTRDVPGQKRGGVRRQRPAPAGAPSQTPDATGPDKEDGGSGTLFLRVAAFLFVFLIGFLAGLSYTPLMNQLQQRSSFAGRGNTETISKSQQSEPSMVVESDPVAQPPSVQPVSVPSPEKHETSAAAPSTREPEQTDGERVSSLSQPTTKSEPEVTEVTALKGTFAGVDTFLTGSGEVSLVRTEDGKDALRISNFSVADLPGLHLALVAAETLDSDADLLTADQISLGPIKAGSDDQDYPLPQGIQFADYPNAVVWSRPFGLLVARAELMSEKDVEN